MATTTHFIVSNMKCQGCVENAKLAVNKINGVEKVNINLAEGVADVEGNIDPQSVCQALMEAGYPAVVKSR